jgi:subtilisin-like proprotein convertase family protein
MPKVHLGSLDEPALELTQSPDLLAVRTHSRNPLQRSAGPVPLPATAMLSDAELVLEYPDAGVEVYRVPKGRGQVPLEERKQVLRAASDVRFAGGVLVDSASGEPVLYTENLFVKFTDDADPDACEAVLHAQGLTLRRALHYADNAWFASMPEGSGQRVFEVAEALLSRSDVEFCHPELIRPAQRKAIAAEQWHLQRSRIHGVDVNAHVNVAAAHVLTRGSGITIAVIDDGFDIEHPDFAEPGKIVAPRDATRDTDDPRPRGRYANHGTACAGVACANGSGGASGVAPEARLMPIRLASALGSQQEADAFVWAADHGADVISCSWGPPDSRWWQPDPQLYLLPASTRLAIDYASRQGRDGRGCVVLFAAGNGNESVDLDGYASYAAVIAVAACNDRSQRSVYSDFGEAVWCCFPSSDFGHVPFNHPDPLTSGIWTTDRRGFEGYNPGGGGAAGDAAGHYTSSFGGTSSACPGVAGVVALMLAANPQLSAQQVRELLAQACERIDPSRGNYDANGHSAWYGYGRVDALLAVQKATPQDRRELRVEQRYSTPLPDLGRVSFVLQVIESQPATEIAVEVELKHTWIGDLQIELVPPAALGLAPIVLHARSGGARRDLKRRYTAADVPALAQLHDRVCAGQWQLNIEDRAAQDSGTFLRFALELVLQPATRAAPAEAPAPRSAGRSKSRAGKRKRTSSREARRA